MNAIKNITIGHTERLYKPVGYTMLANLVNIVPFCLSIEAIRIIFNAFDGSGQPLDTTRLWWIFGIMAVYMLVMALAERASYRANFRGAYEMSASGRLSLAELSLGFLSRRDPGDLSSMLITDFMMAETGISHHLPQLMGAVVMPVLAFASLIWIDWRMAVSMFAALPLALLVLWASTKAQRPMGKYKGAAEAERQANPSEDKCRKPIGGILAGHQGDESLQSVGRPFRPAARCICRTSPCLHPSGSPVRAIRSIEHHDSSCRADDDGTVQHLPLAGRRAFHPCLRAVPRGRLPCVRPTDFRPDQFHRVPILFHCRRTYLILDERAGNERRTAIPGGRRHPI